MTGNPLILRVLSATWSEIVQHVPLFRLSSPSRKKMNLDWQVCSRARLSRDARFDGKFYIGVRGSRVYCRPICPAPTAKEKNVRYFPTAAAAAEAGFRPCLRCRPECSPGTPAWSGTSNTVSRALRLISESGLEDGGVEGLAARLGVGARHLRRLFLKHLGATPSAVAHTRRLHFAKKLVDETVLPMNQVAIASGFGCVRRFNAAIRATYRRTPTQIRRLARPSATGAENQYLFQLRFRPPYHWQGMLDFFARRAIPGVESVEQGVYRRSIFLHGQPGYCEVSLHERGESLAVRIQFGDSCALFLIIERIRAMFDLSADWLDIARTLRSDPVLAQFVQAAPGLRVPGSWDGFELTVRAILGQQVSVASARAVAGRVVAQFGPSFSGAANLTRLFPTPEILAEADLTKAGVTSPRARTIQALARAVCEKKINFEGVVECESFLTLLQEISGIGKWTAQYVAMRALGETDAFPAGDAALLRALTVASPQELELRSEAWRPWRAYATMYLWKSLGAHKVRSGKPAFAAAQKVRVERALRHQRFSKAV
jgi:AraC family transcriptional regulator, regulatory protein of adaptative response / DNA-3-methyladenine glycosylase II